MAPDNLVSPEHGYLAAFITVVNSTLFYLHSLYRRRRRNGSLKYEVEIEVQRIMQMRHTQEALAIQATDHRMDSIEEKLENIGISTDEIDRKLDKLQRGFVVLLSEIRPELIKQLTEGG